MRNVPCSFSESPQSPASFQTDLQNDSVRAYDPTANDLMWYLDQNVCERGSFSPFHVESWLDPCWSIQNLSFPNVAPLPDLQSNSAFTVVNMEDLVRSQTQTTLPIFHPSLQDSTMLAEDFHRNLGIQKYTGKLMSTSQGLTNNYGALYVGGSTALSA